MAKQPVCLVAGVGPGIGSAVARRFARGGYHVVLLARRAEALAEVVAQIEAEGGTAEAYPTDLADLGQLQHTLALVNDGVGAPEVVVYNAAGRQMVHPMQMDPGAFQRDLTVSVTSALACAQAAYKGMQTAKSGTLLFTGGAVSLRPEVGAPVISLAAGKSAMRALALAMAPTLAEDGIHVATVTVAGQVAPGGPFDPDKIAEVYWDLHSQDRGDWKTEVVFDGR